jgi:hypothetical protein
MVGRVDGGLRERFAKSKAALFSFAQAPCGTGADSAIASDDGTGTSDGTGSSGFRCPRFLLFNNPQLAAPACRAAAMRRRKRSEGGSGTKSAQFLQRYSIAQIKPDKGQ